MKFQALPRGLKVYLSHQKVVALKRFGPCAVELKSPGEESFSSRDSCLVGDAFSFQTHPNAARRFEALYDIVSFHNAAAMLNKTLA